MRTASGARLTASHLHDTRGGANLIREMGVVAALRFLNPFRAGAGNYTSERGQWLDELSLNQIAAEIKGRRRKKAKP